MYHYLESESIISYGLKGSCTPLIIENTSVYGISGYKNCELKYMNEKLYRGEIEILNHKSLYMSLFLWEDSRFSTIFYEVFIIEYINEKGHVIHNKCEYKLILES